jgi:hypothetical protein
LFVKFCCAVVLGSLTVLPFLAETNWATTVTFGTTANVPANNTDLAPAYGSNIAGTPADTAAGFITSDGTGATPNIALTWAPAGGTVANAPNIDVLEYHSSTTFTNPAGPAFAAPVLQFDMDLSNHSAPPADPTIDFTVTGGFSLQFHTFQIGNATDQNPATEPPYRWIINLTRLSDMAVVASQTTGFLSAGSKETVTFNYTGDPDEDYRLRFDDEGADMVRTAIDNLSFSQETVAVPKLTLVVNTLTGAVTLANNSGSSFMIDSYEVHSASESLDPAGWNSLQDQDLEGGGAPGTGNGWEEAGGIGTHQLIESYLLGSSTISDGASIPLGSVFDFDKLGVQQDLQFGYHEAGSGGFLRVGNVEYVQTLVAGDYNHNGIVDAADYAVWRDTLGSMSDLRADGDGDGTVQQADYAYWRFRFGNTSGSGSDSGAAAVPEPSTLGPIGVLSIGLTGLALRRDMKRTSARESTYPAAVAPFDQMRGTWHRHPERNRS